MLRGAFVCLILIMFQAENASSFGLKDIGKAIGGELLKKVSIAYGNYKGDYYRC